MTLIEGIGDEVTEFFVLVIIVLVGLIAWWSTSIADQPLIRTVLILERRTRHRVAVDPPQVQTTISSTVDNSIDTGQLELPRSSNENNQEMDGGTDCQICDKEAANISSPLVAAASSSHCLSSNQSSEMPETSNGIVNEKGSFKASPSPGDENSFGESDSQVEVHSCSPATNNANSYLLRSRRLAFFQSRQVTLLDSPVADGPVLSASSSTDSDNIDMTNTTNNEQGTSVVSPGTNDDVPAAGSIRIRLKYLNDDQKLVEGRLHEQLGDFKRRHFGLELAADKLVRLIFNGQVLQSDNETLQGYGLFDNCVVHCLVHQQRSGAASENQLARDSASNANTVPDEFHHRDLDVGSFLFASLSVLLGLAWYCRYQYAQLFNATSTVALVGLTGILTVSFIGIYLPDQDGIRQ